MRPDGRRRFPGRALTGSPQRSRMVGLGRHGAGPFGDEDKVMRTDIHPEYRPVVFYDVGADFKVLTRSTVNTKDTIDFEGKEYPCVKLEISSASHPFFTGTEKFIDTAGRVERFQTKFGGNYFDKKKPKKPKHKRRL
jgi:large subunit ribosomal protein L31